MSREAQSKRLLTLHTSERMRAAQRGAYHVICTSKCERKVPVAF
jgi:hypothetical protein